MSSKQTLISVVIPTYERPVQLTHCLDSLINSDYPREKFEVIVVDDGSRMPIQPSLEDYRSQINLTVLRQENAGPASARNRGAAYAKGEFLVFIDDDCTLAPDYLTKLANHLAKQPDSMIGGRTVNTLLGNPYATASQLLIDYLYADYIDEPQRITFFTSNNMALPRERFHAIGRFDVSFPLAAGEDRELCGRWRVHQLSMHYAPDAVVYHAHRLTLADFWRQHVHYGRGSFHFHSLRAQRQRESIQLERLSFYLNLLHYPLKREQPPRAWLLLGLILLSQIATAIGYFRMRRDQGISTKRAWQ
jgi:GT2 family glycosyltransferase